MVPSSHVQLTFMYCVMLSSEEGQQNHSCKLTHIAEVCRKLKDKQSRKAWTVYMVDAWSNKNMINRDEEKKILPSISFHSFSSPPSWPPSTCPNALWAAHSPKVFHCAMHLRTLLRCRLASDTTDLHCGCGPCGHLGPCVTEIWSHRIAWK